MGTIAAAVASLAAVAFAALAAACMRMQAVRERPRPLQEWLLLRRTAAKLEQQQQQQQQQEQQQEQQLLPQEKQQQETGTGTATAALSRILPSWAVMSRLQQQPLPLAAFQVQQQQQQQETISYAARVASECFGAALTTTAAAAAAGRGPLFHLLRFLHNEERGSNRLNGELHIHFTKSRHYHAKNIVADSLWTSIGSFNFDRYPSTHTNACMHSPFPRLPAAAAAAAGAAVSVAAFDVAAA